MSVLRIIRNFILNIIDMFYIPFFKKFIPIDTFRYAFCGGANTAFDIFLFYLNYNFILQKKILNLGIITISPHIAAFMMSFAITFPTGFFLSKYITFTQSLMRGRIQLIRYGITVLVCILLNYIFLKLFVEILNLYPTPSKILTTCLVVIYSYFSQKYFTFKVKNTTIVN